ncbi:MAG: hypothetical protein IJJ28_01800, partial [Lentisphaeria bacterium]|nr:hypothetical protein [Lentisphaeria bacterium]
MKQVLKKIENPGPEFRSAPFWAWNGKLEEGELREQIRAMKQMGMGGFFMHSRLGLDTPYLSEEWFDLVAACVDEAEKLGMKAWLYDEDRWPSGTAGGLVTKDKRFRIRYLQCSVDTEFPEREDSVELARYAVRFYETTVIAYRRIKRGAKLDDGERLMVFNRFIASAGDTWFNGQCYLDTLNPKAVEKFIETTHEAYLRHLPKSRLKAIPGIFTDEPNMHVSCPKNSLPWTDGLEKSFRKRYGYDLLDRLPELFYPFLPEIAERGLVNLRSEFSKVRLDYRNLLADTFRDAFAKTVGKWCDRHKLIFTGHLLREDSMREQIHDVGSAMRFYEYMSAPGIDVLTEHWNVFITAKQCSSVAHQLGKDIRLSETYACTGWDFPFMGHKALGDWQYALGINFRCQHLAWYSMAAEAKRDYPASISYQSPWWKSYGAVEDYFARLGAALSKGEEQRDLLLIHPIESMMGTYVYRTQIEGEDTENTDRDRQLIKLANGLLSAHLDFDFGEEEMMSRHATVTGKKLKVGKASYKDSRTRILPVLPSSSAT